MAKLPILPSIAAGFRSFADVNAAFQRIKDSFTNTLSRDGSSPNSMQAVIDMNSNRIINLASPLGNTDAASKEYVDGALEAFSGGTAATGPQGPTGPTGATGPQGSIGPSGAPGSNGINGWSPILSVISDSARRVLQVIDWTGGQGTKPTTGQYISSTGLTGTLASAVDIRGPAGSAGAGSGDMIGANNLSDVVSVATSRTNLGLGTSAVHATSDFLQTANNLSDVTPATARSNLGLGAAALKDNSFFVQTGNNLSDLASASTARSNLGIGVVGTKADLSTVLAAGTGISLSTTGGVTTITATGGGGSGSSVLIGSALGANTTGTLNETINFPVNTAAGDLAVVYVYGNNVAVQNATWGSAVAGTFSGTSVIVLFKCLTPADITTGSVTVTKAVSGLYKTAIEVYRGPTSMAFATFASGTTNGSSSTGFTKTLNNIGTVAAYVSQDITHTIVGPASPFTNQLNDLGTTYSLATAFSLSYVSGSTVAFTQTGAPASCDLLLFELIR